LLDQGTKRVPVSGLRPPDPNCQIRPPAGLEIENIRFAEHVTHLPRSRGLPEFRHRASRLFVPGATA
jgi:hypothetical protein